MGNFEGRFVAVSGVAVGAFDAVLRSRLRERSRSLMRRIRRLGAL